MKSKIFLLLTVIVAASFYPASHNRSQDVWAQSRPGSSACSNVENTEIVARGDDGAGNVVHPQRY
jgi:hypothetical protein